MKVHSSCKPCYPCLFHLLKALPGDPVPVSMTGDAKTVMCHFDGGILVNLLAYSCIWRLPRTRV